MRKLELIAKGYPIRIHTSQGGYYFYFRNRVESFAHLPDAVYWAIHAVEEANKPLRQ